MPNKGVFFILSPYKSDFRVSQTFKGSLHDGLDLVGTDKKIYSVCSGVVTFASYENVINHMQGFGLYVRIQDSNYNVWYYGHLSKVCVNVGDKISIGDLIGVEGSTGRSTGSHLHLCCRRYGSKKNIQDICKLTSIPNKIGKVKNVKYYLVKRSWKDKLLYRTQYITQARIFAKNKKCVVYDENGKTIYNFRS